ncbi:MAG: UTP--glucose-1-phosphate uridylyltransferase GalU [Terracidiphilus sp.]|jgi:UTP--glucose-1-phosphate uridylyltransferase
MRKVFKAVLPAAGLGTRFLPATKAIPKEMLPLVDKPLIQYAAEEAYEAGISNLIVVTGRGKTAIEDHFDLNIELEHHLLEKGKAQLAEELHQLIDRWKIAYIRQHMAKGLGHAVLQAKPLVGDEAFAVLLADDVILAQPCCLAQLLAVHEKTGESVVALMNVPKERVSSYGIAWGDPVEELSGENAVIRLRGMVEKPAPGAVESTLAVVGRYILHPGVIEELEHTDAGRNGEIQLTDAIEKLTQKRAVYGVMFTGRRFDAGEKLGFLKASIEIALRNPELAAGLREYLNQRETEL